MPSIVNQFAPAKPVKTAAPKGECAVSHDEFCRNAQPLSVTIAGQTAQAKPYEFSTGTLGWLLPTKVTVKLANGQEVPCQVDLKLYVVNSKNAYRGEKATVE